jgi:hypothetical protein
VKKKEFGNTDSKEKARELSPAEKQRLEKFEALSDDLIRQGYRRTELTISIVKANIFAIGLMVAALVIGLVLFFLANDLDSVTIRRVNPLLWILAFAVLIVVHELIHGVSWAIFTEHHFGDIAFGFMKQYLTPYCACAVPLSKGQYIFGALMPLLLVGILPMIVGILSGSFFWLLIGAALVAGAGGDIQIVGNILRYKSEADDILYIDHPTQAGGVIFEK